MWLTGRADGPPLLVSPSLGAQLGEVAAGLGLADLDVMALLGERAAITGMFRGGRTSVGGRCRLMPTADDGWVAVSLARPEDHESVPAWLGIEPGRDLWADVEAAVAARPAAEVLEQGVLLGLPIGGLGECASTEPVVSAIRLGSAPPGQEHAAPLVVDLSSLWAGPLCAHLLGSAGARVVKVESLHRPDGARRGPRRFYDLLHSGHRSVALDFSSGEGRRQLLELLMVADVVIEGSRPRALEQMGIDAAQIVADGGPRVWASITAYGRRDRDRDRIGFGDDAAVAGGLVAWEGGEPRFCADAVADPLTGIAAAAAIRTALAGEGRWLLDIALARVAAWMAGRAIDGVAIDGAATEDGTGWTGEVATPQARPIPAIRAPGIGEQTGQVMAEIRLRRRGA